MSEPRGLSPNGPLPTLDRRVTLHFTVPYNTVWGQNILLTGSGALLGGLQWSRARNMTCHHEKDALVWEATVVLPWKPFYTYKYALVRQALDPSYLIAGCVMAAWQRGSTPERPPVHIPGL